MFREGELTVKNCTKSPDSFIDHQELTVKFDLYIVILQIEQPRRRGNMEDGELVSVKVKGYAVFGE